MMKYACGICLALSLFLFWQNKNIQKELEQSKIALNMAIEVNKDNLSTIENLESALENTNKSLEGWNEDRTRTSALRRDSKQELTEAMNETSFKDWASSPVPPHAWGLLNKTASDFSGKKKPFASSTNSTAGRL